MNQLKAFEVLGIQVTASRAEIKQAWKDLLIIWHPDKHNENERRRKLAEEKTEEINEAYEITCKYDCRRDQQQSRYQKEQKKQTTNTKETTARKRKSKNYKKGWKKQTTNAESEFYKREYSWPKNHEKRDNSIIEKINAVIILFIIALPIVVAIIWVTIEAIVWAIDTLIG